jgi:ferredoxin
MKVAVNDDCTLCGLCADTCPQVFELGEEKALVIADPVPVEAEDDCRDAADSCPVDAIEIID